MRVMFREKLLVLLKLWPTWMASLSLFWLHTPLLLRFWPTASNRNSIWKLDSRRLTGTSDENAPGLIGVERKSKQMQLTSIKSSNNSFVLLLHKYEKEI